MLTPLLLASLSFSAEIIKPVTSEVVQPIRNASFNKGGKARVRKQGGNPRTVSGTLIFDGSMDGDRQVDPQIAVGGGYVFHGSNSGLIVYDKAGNYVQGVPQSEFNDGIDPKIYFDPNNRVFCFDLWTYWDKEKKKPVNISVSETENPLGAWNTYPFSAPEGVDGGAIGGSQKWIGYSFPGGKNQTFVMRMDEAKSGKPVTVYHFEGSLGHPVVSQDKGDDLYFVQLTDADIRISKVVEGAGGAPVVASVVSSPHPFKYFSWPPGSPMKGTNKTTSSGDRNPKNLVLQGGHFWFSHTVNIDGRAGIQWHQVSLQGQFVQSGVLSHPVNSYIQTTLAVNKRNDVLVGFQETGPNMFISGRCAFRLAKDKPGTLRPTIPLGTGLAATEGGAWGDYSGSCVDGDNMIDLWTVQSVADSQGNGDTVIARIKPKKK